MRCVYERLELLLAEGRLRASIRPPAIVRIHLDPIGAAPRLLARSADDVGHTTRLLRALGRTADVRPQATRRRTVRAGGNNRSGRNEQTRTGNEAILNRALQPHVGEIRSLGSQVT